MARARFEAGDALREDIARAEMERARVRVEHRRVEALREQARARLAAEMGEPAAATLPLEGSLFSTFDVPAIEEVAANLASHPAVTGAASDVRARVARLELAQAERIPDVKVEVLYRRLAGDQENAFDVGASIPLPIFDRNRGRLREARADVAAAEARARATRSALDLSLRETYAQLGAALANSRMLQAEVLPNAEVVRKTAEARYAVGDLGLAEVLSVRRDWASAQLTCLESLRDVMQAWAALGPFLKPN
jgi:cobalt-zinc-cadmium efflux system outer membrane protein